MKPMRLTDLSPQWIDLGDRKGLGFLWRCSTGHCEGWNVTLLANPLDGGPPFPGDSWALVGALEMVGLIRGCGMARWKRDPATTTFENLTLSPSVNAHECGHWTVINGELRR